MKIAELTYKPFSIKLKSPFVNSYNTLDERKGFIVSLTDDSGNSSLGEASPLPGFSRDSLDEAEEDLTGLFHLLKGMEIGTTLRSVKDIADDYILSNSVKFAFEQAMIGLLVKRDTSFIKKQFNETKKTINVNAVIGFEKEEKIFTIAEKKLSEGFSTFKFKVGRNNFADDINLIKEIRSRYGSEIKIRLDANGKWDLDVAKYNLDKLEAYNIEYIEEPCRGIENLAALSQNSPIPVVPDESLASIDDAYRALEESNISFVIIKPMILGSFIENAELIKQAAILEKNIIISSSFETALGKDQLVLLSSLTHHSFAHGLDTAEYFPDYFFDDPYKIKNGAIVISPLYYPNAFDYNGI